MKAHKKVSLVYYVLVHVLLNYFPATECSAQFTVGGYFDSTGVSPILRTVNAYWQQPQAHSLDTICRNITGSVRFVLLADRQIEQVAGSINLSAPVKTALEEAIRSTAMYWRLPPGQSPKVIVQTIYISPAKGCEVDVIASSVRYRDASLQFRYIEPTDSVYTHHTYFTTQLSFTEGIILPPIPLNGTKRH